MPRTLVVALLLASPAALAAEPDPLFAELQRVTTHDAQAPLEVTELARDARADATVIDLTYRGAEGPVPALLVLPAGKGPFPAVVFQHWAQGDKTQFLEDARMLARAGAVSLLVDAPFVRPAPHRRPMGGPGAAKMTTQAVIDVRRALDFLATRPEVDRARLGYVGHSFGARIGGVLSGVEKRLTAYVLMGGIGDYSHTLSTSNAPQLRAWRASTPKADFEALLKSLAPLDGIVGVRAAAPSKVFFQYAREDDLVTYEQAMKFVRAASEPKLFKFYEGGHAFNEAARRDRLQWLRTELGFGPIAENGPPMIRAFGISDPSWQRAPPFEPGKLRPVYEVPGQSEVEVKKNLVYKNTDGRSYALDLYFPPAAKGRTFPMVVLVHGSVHPAILRHIKDLPLYEDQARWIAASGFVVAVPSLGSPATGPKPSEWYSGVAGVRANLLEAVTFLRAQAEAHSFDKDRICLMTFSAGGLYGISPALDAPAPWLRCVVGYYPLLEGPEAPIAREVAPLALVKTTRAKVPPMFLVKAGRDFAFLNKSLDAFARDAKRRKLPVTVRELPLAHHSFELIDDTEDTRAAMRETLKFLSANLGP